LNTAWKSKVQYHPTNETPSVLFIVADETSYWAMQSLTGKVRDGLPNIQELQRDSITYQNAYAATANTDFSVPAIFNGVGDVVRDSNIYKAENNSLFGFFPDSKSGFKRFFSSEIFDTPCAQEDVDCSGQSTQSRYKTYLLDFTAIVGKNNLVGLRRLFPAISEKTKNYWDSVVPVSEFERLKMFYESTRNSPKPKFAFLHTLQTHNQWNKDVSGNVVWTVDHAEVGNFNNRELIAIRKQLYFSALKNFDSELGQVLDLMKALNLYDNTIIVLTADHGVGFNTTQALGEISGDGGRQGNTLSQLWNEIAHVPLLIKYADQQNSQLEKGVRSLGSVASTVVGELDGTWADGSEPMHGLTFGSSKDVIFSDTTRGIDPKLSWGLPDDFEFLDPWLPMDFPGNNIATSIGIDERRIGSQVPEGYVSEPFKLERFGLSSSPFGLVSVVVDHCPHKVEPAFLVFGNRIVSSIVFEAPVSVSTSLIGWSITSSADPLNLWCADK